MSDNVSGPEKLARKLALEPCDSCHKPPEVKARWSGCGCLLGQMYCPACEKTVNRTGNDSDGFGIYRHGCSVMTEDKMIDPRALPFLTETERRGE